MKRVAAILIPFLALVSLAVPQTVGMLYLSSKHNLKVGRNPVCLQFPEFILALYPARGFSAQVEDQKVCFVLGNAAEPAQTTVELESGKRSAYSLIPDLSAPEAFFRVIVPQQSPATLVQPGSQAATPPDAPVSTIPTAPSSASPQPSVPGNSGSKALAALPTDVQQLATVIAKVLTSMPQLQQYGKLQATESSASQQVVATPVEDPKDQNDRPVVPTPAATSQENPAASEKTHVDNNGVSFDATLFPKDEKFTIGYTIRNYNRYPVLSDPSNFKLLLNGMPVDAELTQKSTSGVAGWIPKDYQEIGYITFDAPKEQGTLRLQIRLTRLSPTRDNVSLEKSWELRTMPVATPTEP